MSVNYDKFATFMAASTAFTPGATPQDVVTLTGNATTNVYVQKMAISTTQTTAGVNGWLIAKRSTANSGGTSAGLTEVPLRSSSDSASATALQYTANPTAGTLVGNIWTGWVISNDVTGATENTNIQVVDFESELGEPIALLSSSEVIAWNFGGEDLPTGLSVRAWIKWVEAPKT